MNIPFNEGLSKKKVDEILKGFECIDLLQWVDQIKV